MDTTEVAQHPDPGEAELRAWDWYTDLKTSGRAIPWLARQTDRQQNTVYRYRWGTLTPSLDWLRSAARVLGKVGAS